MYENVTVHERVCRRHPDLTEADVHHAWRNRCISSWRLGTEGVLLAIGVDTAGRQIEMIAQVKTSGTVVIYHAKRSPTDKFRREVGLRR